MSWLLPVYWLQRAEAVETGSAICDALDRGDSFRPVLMIGVAFLRSAESVESVAAQAGLAAVTRCPEHSARYGLSPPLPRRETSHSQPPVGGGETSDLSVTAIPRRARVLGPVRSPKRGGYPAAGRT